MKINKPKLNTNKIFLIILLLFPFYKPDCLTSFYYINYIYTLMSIAVFTFLFIIYIKKMKINKFDILIWLFYGILMISTFLNEGSMLKVISDLSLNIGIVLLANLFLKENKLEFLKALSIYFYALLILNTISIVVFPNGIAQTEYLKTPIYLIGIDNRFAFTYLPGLCIIAIYDYLINKKFTKFTYIYFLATYITFLYFWSAGALVAETLFIIFYILVYKFKKKKLVNKYFPTVIILFFTLVIFRLQNLFKYIIVNVLHKDLTLSSRTLIWDKVIEIISEHKILGIGVQKSNTMIALISAYHSHSYFLNIMLQAGIIGIIIYIIIVFKVFKRLNNNRENFISQIIAFSLFVLYIMLLVDTFDITANLFLLLTIGYNIKYLINDNIIIKKESKE
ncbi:o-antigen polymerase [Clostridium sp. CAG:571]|nr:o-antigen polymerase [Clostridium sp. CAG:571]